MLEQFTLKIKEIFWSIQGEGERTGFPSIFVRLAGCSLGCETCDTTDSWQIGEERSPDSIVGEVKLLQQRYPASQLVITGGEPLEQDLSVLVASLKSLGLFLAIETNGINDQTLPIDWWTVSPKDKSGYRIRPSLEEKISEVKLLVTGSLSPDTISRIRFINPGFPIYLQPECHDADRYQRTFDLYKKVQTRGLNNIRLGIQLHRIYDIE